MQYTDLLTRHSIQTDLKLTKSEWSLFCAFVRYQSLPFERLYGYVWTSPDKEPKSAENSLSISIYKINKKLKHCNFKISCPTQHFRSISKEMQTWGLNLFNKENSFQENSFQENSFQENSFQENSTIKLIDFTYFALKNKFTNQILSRNSYPAGSKNAPYFFFFLRNAIAYQKKKNLTETHEIIKIYLKVIPND